MPLKAISRRAWGINEDVVVPPRVHVGCPESSGIDELHFHLLQVCKSALADIDIFLGVQAEI